MMLSILVTLILPTSCLVLEIPSTRKSSPNASKSGSPRAEARSAPIMTKQQCADARAGVLDVKHATIHHPSFFILSLEFLPTSNPQHLQQRSHIWYSYIQECALVAPFCFVNKSNHLPRRLGLEAEEHRLSWPWRKVGASRTDEFEISWTRFLRNHSGSCPENDYIWR